MKLLNRHIDMISWTSKDGTVTPIRFRMEENGEMIVVKVARILQTEKTMFGASSTLIFRCCSMVQGEEKVYELTCDCEKQKWLLKKM